MTTKVKNIIQIGDKIFTKGKLVLIEQPINKETHDNIMKTIIILDSKPYKPIYISETEGETVAIGESIYIPNLGKIFLVTNNGISSNYDYYRILALSENFSQEQLQMIVNGELKDGDEVLIEIGYKNDFNGEKSYSCILTTSGKYKYITLQKVEEDSWKGIIADYMDKIGQVSMFSFAEYLKTNFHPPKRK